MKMAMSQAIRNCPTVCRMAVGGIAYQLWASPITSAA